MPTAAKLFAAVSFAVLGFIAAEVFKSTVERQEAFGSFSLIVAALGLLIGWSVMGSLAGRGYRASIGYGLRTSVTLAFWALLGFSIYQMLQLALKKRYDGPMEAVVGIFNLMLENGQRMLTPELLITFGVGGVVGGFMAEWASRRWA